MISTAQLMAVVLKERSQESTVIQKTLILLTVGVKARKHAQVFVALRTLFTTERWVASFITSLYSLPHLGQRSHSLQGSSLPLRPVSGHGHSSIWRRRNPVSGWSIPSYVHVAPAQSSSPGGCCPHWLLRKFAKTNHSSNVS